MTETMTVAGLDVHARSTHAAAIDVRSGELRRARFGAGTDEVVAWLLGLPAPVRACYEAGPTGFALYRAGEAAGVPVEVVAPSKTPRPSGDRIKTDRKDAELLARLLLAGQLAAVAVPSPAYEGARHLARAREQVRGDLMRGRHRVSKLLLLDGRVYLDGRAWTKRHRRWLERQRFEQSPAELAYADALAAVDGLVARKSVLDERLSRLACEGEWWPTVARLRCFRGIDTLTAFVLTLEIGAFARFARPQQLASWLGLVPSLSQSGESRAQGAITKTGSAYARRLLVEAAWQYLPRPDVGPALAERRAGQPAEVIQIALRAQRRLHRLYRSLQARGKPRNVVTVAVARELACFLWAAATV
ncbi:MAG TPA: IS110 family transposase [Roseiflexaceae bacterium]